MKTKLLYGFLSILFISSCHYKLQYNKEYSAKIKSEYNEIQVLKFTDTTCIFEPRSFTPMGQLGHCFDEVPYIRKNNHLIFNDLLRLFSVEPLDTTTEMSCIQFNCNEASRIQFYNKDSILLLDTISTDTKEIFILKDSSKVCFLKIQSGFGVCGNPTIRINNSQGYKHFKIHLKFYVYPFNDYYWKIRKNKIIQISKQDGTKVIYKLDNEEVKRFYKQWEH